MCVLSASRLNFVAKISRPDYLVCSVLDFFAFEEIVAVFVAGEIDHMIIPRSECPRDRKKHGVAEAAASEQDVFVFRDLGRRTGRAHYEHFLALLEQRAKPRRRSHFEND